MLLSRTVKLKVRRSLWLLAIIACKLVLPALAADCFPQSEVRMPYVMAKDDGTGQPEQASDGETYQAIVGNNDYIIAGGKNTNSGLNALTYNSASVITRIDLATHIHKWSRTYHVDDSTSTTEASVNVLGMALEDDGNRVAVWLSRDALGHDSENYMLIINAVDGGHITKQARKVKHTT